MMRSPTPSPFRAGRPLAVWARCEDGAMIVFGLFVFLAMLLFAGVAVDMMRYEHERIRLQGATDRAVLAATMLRENVSGARPEQIVRAYMEAEGLGGAVADGGIDVEEGDQGRIVTVSPAARLPTMFMRMLGQNELPIATPAQAIEALSGPPRIEIVMVLDISGSMAGSRIANLRTAAAQMAESLLSDAEPGQVAITLVPYTQFVVLPPGMINHFANLPAGGEACIDFQNWTDIRNSVNAAVRRWYCLTDDFYVTRPYMHDAAQAVARINALQPTWITQIDLGVRAGALFFDPSMRPAIDQMIANGQIHSAFAGRPFDWNEPGVIRAMILMTDGDNCCGQRYETAPGIWPGNQDANTASVCTAIRNEGVTLYTVAFEASPRGIALMEACASSPNHYFNTSGAGIIDVFAGIGNHIQTQALRLIQ